MIFKMILKLGGETVTVMKVSISLYLQLDILNSSQAMEGVFICHFKACSTLKYEITLRICRKLFIIYNSILKLGGETHKVAKQEYSFEFLTVSLELISNDKDFIPISI